jgi:16S rRNA (guanine1207-N2)-methyltransferase
MTARDSISEHLLLDALTAAWRQDEHSDLADTAAAGPAILLVGVQRPDTLVAANALAGPARVYLLHLDRATETVGRGYGNTELMLGDDTRTASLMPGSFRIVGLNVEAARSYRLLREIVGQAAALVHPDGCLLVAGPRKGGAEVAAVTLRALFEHVELATYRKGHRVYRASRPLAVENIAAVDAGTGSAPSPLDPHEPVTEQILTVELRGKTLRLVQDARIFARGQMDPASRMLAEVFEAPPGADVLDLGCGGGILGILAALLDPTAHCTLVDADPLAVAAARRGAALSGAEHVSVHLSDVLADLPGKTYDVVLMNPPFHRGRVQDRTLAERFLTQSSAALRPGGQLWVVCNRFLPYERTLSQVLGVPREVAGDRSYKVLMAERPGTPRHVP